MPRPRLPYLQKETTRHGRTVWYFRRGKGPRVRVNGDYGSEEFRVNYQAALDGRPMIQKQAAEPSGSLGWLVARYRESAAWERLSKATRDQREGFYRQIVKVAGDVPTEAITREKIEEGMDDRRKTPFAAMDFLKAMRGLFGWAKESRHIKVNPTEGVKGFGKKTNGWHVWTDDEIERFETKWPIGTRERLALAILLFTGFRRGDAAKLGPQHVRNGIITLRTEKTGSDVIIPMLPELAAVIEATKTGPQSFIATVEGRPMTKESFGNWFGEACEAAGVPGRAHGLRKAGATRAANNGATEAELEAIFGWTGGKMASLYTRQANREKLARAAIAKLSPIPLPKK
jgi:integrase